MSEPVNSNGSASPDAELRYADSTTPRVPDATPLGRWDFAVIVTKLIGVYLLVFEALPYLGASISLLSEGGWQANKWGVAVYGGLTLFFLIAGLFLFLAGDRVAHWLLPRSELNAGTASERLTAKAVQEVAFSVVGVYVALLAVPGFAGAVWHLKTIGPSSSESWATELAPNGLQLATGALLFLGSKRLSDYWHALRHSRRTSTDDGPL